MVIKHVLILSILPFLLQGQTPHKKVLFFSKAASNEQKIVHRDNDQMSYIEKIVQRLGEDNGIDFTFSKDGRIFTPENIAKYDAFFFFTAGDLTHEERTGRGDNYPLMTLDGKKAFLDAIHDGKGFVGCNTANFTFPSGRSPGEPDDPEHAWRYTKMIGAGYMGHNDVQQGHFTYLDRKFPGMENVPPDYEPVDQWYAFNRITPDLHVIMALDAPKLHGNMYERPPFPAAWARMEGTGRVFYTTMGHTAEIWKDPVFMQMLLGGLRWTTRLADADVAPDLDRITPHATEIPQHASKYISNDPPMPNPHFPGIEIHFPKSPELNRPLSSAKHVLFFSKSAGYEHLVLYRVTSTPSPAELVILKLGQANNIDVAFSKEGTIFTPEDIAKYDAFLFYTSGDLTDPARNGPGDNNKVMPPEAPRLLVEAVRSGKGFIGIHSSIDTLTGFKPYANMLGAAYDGHGVERNDTVLMRDSTFPGMSSVPAGLASTEEWYSFKNLQPDLHIILARGANQPVAWARMEGKGRVYYTSLGHGQEIWANPSFQQMILGAIRWTTGAADAGIAPGDSKVQPR